MIACDPRNKEIFFCVWLSRWSLGTVNYYVHVKQITSLTRLAFIYIRITNISWSIHKIFSYNRSFYCTFLGRADNKPTTIKRLLFQQSAIVNSNDCRRSQINTRPWSRNSHFFYPREVRRLIRQKTQTYNTHPAQVIVGKRTCSVRMIDRTGVLILKRNLRAVFYNVFFWEDLCVCSTRFFNLSVSFFRSKNALFNPLHFIFCYAMIFRMISFPGKIEQLT